MRSLGERRKLPSGVWGIPQPQTILGVLYKPMYFYAISRIFYAFQQLPGNGTFLHPLYRLAGLMFPVNFLGCRTPQLEFLAHTE